jgi:hypothetical protein
MATQKTTRIDWRKLLLPFLFIMVLPTISAMLVDFWLGSRPFATIIAIIVCFPAATVVVTKNALSEMDRVIAEVVPPSLPEPSWRETESGTKSD